MKQSFTILQMYHATATALLGELESDSDALEVILIIGAHFLSIDLCSVLFCKQKKYCANNCFTRVYAMLKRCTIIYRPCKFSKDFFSQNLLMLSQGESNFGDMILIF